jgi:hypothetical protein
MPSLIQPSFARGELGPELHGRTDISAYRVALATARNAIIHSYGGVSNRAGLHYLGPCKEHTYAPRLIPFKFKTTDAYILEFGNLYMRVIRNNAHVTETDVNISAVSLADPCVVTTSTTHGYTTGDEVFISGIVGTEQLNTRRFIITVLTTTTFSLQDQFDGGVANIDSTDYDAWESGGTVAKIFEIVTTYATADLDTLKFVQSADVLTITHPTYPVREVSRTGHAAWTIADVTFQPAQDHPTALTAAQQGATGTTTYSYKVVAEGLDTQELSMTALSTDSSTPESATAADPIVVTDTSHGWTDGEEIEINGFNEMTEVNGRRFIVGNKTTHTYELHTDIHGTTEKGSGYTAEVTGGTANSTEFSITNGNATLTGADFVLVSWTHVAGAERYHVFRFENDLYGLIGKTEDNTFDDYGQTIPPDTEETPPRVRDPFRGADQFPAAVSYYEQRRVFGGTNDKPDTSYYTQTGNHNNLNVSNPLRVDDAITATLNATEVNAIRHFVPLNDLLILTSGEEWRVNSGQETGFTSSSLRQKPQTRWGAGHQRPIVIGSTVLFVQEDNSVVRTIGFSLQIDGYTGTDITVLAPHIFRDYTLVEWAYARSPDTLTYMVRSDGDVATLTFNEEQEVVAWTRWDTPGGKFERVSSIRPSATVTEDAGYFVVKRLVNGNTVRFIEYTHSRQFTDIRDAFFVDSGLSLDVPLAISDITSANPVVVTIGSGSGLADGDEVDIHDTQWTPAFDDFDNESNPGHLNTSRFLINDVTATTMALAEAASDTYITAITQANPGKVTTLAAHGLTTGDKVALNNIAGMTEANNNTYTVTVVDTTSFTIGVDTSAFTAYTLGGKVHASIDGSAYVAYLDSGNVYEVEDEFSGLWHLEGEEVVGLADGNVIKGLTVTDGAVTLPREAGRVHLGLKYITDIETLNIDSFSSRGTLQGLKKHISYVTVRFDRSRGLWIGPNNGDLTEMKQREDEAMSDPTTLLTGDKRIPIPPSWDTNGRLFMRQRDPLPLTILAVVPFIEGEEDE